MGGSYDAASAILRYYKDRKKFMDDLHYAATKAYKGREVFLFSDAMVIPRKSNLPYINTALRYNSRLFQTKKDAKSRCGVTDALV